MLRSDLCDHSDAYIVAKKTIDLLAAPENGNDKAQENIAFKKMPNLDHVFQRLTVH